MHWETNSVCCSKTPPNTAEYSSFKSTVKKSNFMFDCIWYIFRMFTEAIDLTKWYKRKIINCYYLEQHDLKNTTRQLVVHNTLSIGSAVSRYENDRRAVKFHGLYFLHRLAFSVRIQIVLSSVHGHRDFLVKTLA